MSEIMTIVVTVDGPLLAYVGGAAVAALAIFMYVKSRK